MSRKINVAVAQFQAELGAVESNLKRCLDYINKAGERGADIVCFPELCHTGYGLNEKQAHVKAEIFSDTLFMELSSCAAKNNIYVIYSYIEKDERDNLFISALLLNREGIIIGNYRKCYLWDSYEQKIFSSDVNFPVFQTDFGKIGILICYDMEYPETARKLWKQGVDIIFVPMHFWTIDYMNKYAQAAAIYNTIPIVAVNGVADDKESCSKVLDEYGNIIMECKAKGEDFQVCQIEVGKDSKQRRIHMEEFKEI